MAYDAFLKIEGEPIDGESTKKGRENEIEIFSFSFGAHAPATMGLGAKGLGASKVSISSLNLMKRVDAASAKLFLSCATGKHHKKATLSLRKATGEGGQMPFLTYTFETVLIESIQWSGSGGGDDHPTESVSIAFEKVHIEYKVQDEKGGLKTKGEATYDIAKQASK